MTPFAPFGPTHVIALLATVVVAAAAAAFVRRDPQGRLWLVRVYAVSLLAAGVGFVVVDALAGVSWRYIAPLHLCDVAVFVGAWALWTRRQLAFELIYAWGLAGATLAMLTPDIAEDFPHHRFLFYFAQHGMLVVAAVVLAAGLSMRPRKRAWLRAWLWLNALAAVVAVVNLSFDTNFLYLCATPSKASPLDWLGAWPWYIVASELVALALFAAVMVPFAGRCRSASE